MNHRLSPCALVYALPFLVGPTGDTRPVLDLGQFELLRVKFCGLSRQLESESVIQYAGVLQFKRIDMGSCGGGYSVDLTINIADWWRSVLIQLHRVS